MLVCSALFDPVRRRIVLRDGGSAIYEWDTHRRELRELLRVGAADHDRRGRLVHDPLTGRALLLQREELDPAQPSEDPTPLRVWRYDGASIEELAGESPPEVSYLAGAAYDVPRGRVVVVSDGSTWEYDVGEQRWVEVVADGAPDASDYGAMLYDTAAGRVLLVNGETEDDADTMGTWEYVHRRPGARWAAQVFAVLLEPDTAVSDLTVTWVGDGRGDQAGARSDGAELLVWDWEAWAWESWGSHTSPAGAAAADRTVTGTADAPDARHVSEGILWLLAAPLHPSAQPPGEDPSTLATGYLEVEATLGFGLRQ